MLGGGALGWVKKLEHLIVLVICAMLSVIVVLATVELGVGLVRDIAAPPVMFPGIDKLLDLFSRVLLVVMGLELVETMRIYALEGVARVEVVITVSAIALARRVIVLEPGSINPSATFAIAALFAALAIAYRAFVRSPP
jgi:uncharacterized membrane protein (DUF373 family)